MTETPSDRDELVTELNSLRQENRRLKQRISELQQKDPDDDPHLLLDNIETHIFYLTDPGTYGRVNRAHAEFLGVSKSDLEGKPLRNFLSKDEVSVCTMGNKSVFDGKTQVITEELMQRADGEFRLFSFTKTPKLNENGDVEYVVCTAEDITEQKSVQRLLTFTQFTIDQAKIAIFWCHADGSFFYANQTACDWLMYSFEELERMHVADINPQFPREAWPEHWQEIKEKGLVHMESSHKRSNGEIYPVEIYSNYVKFEGEEYKLSFVSDITDKVKAREELASSQYFLENVIESIQDGVCVLDKEYNILHTNRVMRQWYEGKGELIGRKCYKAFHSNDIPCSTCPTEKALKSGNTESEIIPGVEGGPAEWLEVYSYPLKDRNTGEISGVVEFVRDITDRIKLEKQLSQAQKMEALGTLAGGIAHDFNNILQAIQGSIQLLQIQKQQDHPDQKYLQMIGNSTERAKELTSRMLFLGRQVSSDLQPVDLNKELSNLVKLLERTIPKMISIKELQGVNLNTIMADLAQVEQVILNLAINASHAMPDGGELTLQTESCRVDDSNVCGDGEIPHGNYVTLTVTDTGHGMDQKTLTRIYEPFFSTKPQDSGSGLGLSMVYGIVKSHGGSITCYSKLGVGTTFRLYFPAIETTAKKVVSDYRTNNIPRGSETILLVDDENDILEILEALLGQFGYSTFSVKSGEQAIQHLQKEGSSVDLVILDLNMPGMGGHKCLKSIRKMLPNLKIIIASGFAADSNTQNMLKTGAQAFVAKPYQAGEMLSAIRQVLDS